MGAVYLNYGLHRHHGPEGVFGRTWPTGTMAFWTTVMLTLYLVLANSVAGDHGQPGTARLDRLSRSGSGPNAMIPNDVPGWGAAKRRAP